MFEETHVGVGAAGHSESSGPQRFRSHSTEI